MSRASRIPYHQNVYDLLQIEPGESPEAARMITEHEAKHGPLPASVREWYLVPNAVPLRETHEAVGMSPHHARSLMLEYTNDPSPIDLEWLLRRCATTPDRVVELTYEFDGHWWLLQLTGDDPPVKYGWERSDWPGDSVPFSVFLAEWFALGSLPPFGTVAESRRQQPHSNGLWLRVPDEPFQPPVIDFLIDRFGEPQRTPRPGGVTTYAYRPPGGTIRVTADEPALTGGLSAWWVHADTPERLAELAELLLPWGTLRVTLRADTDPARDVLKRVRGGVG